MKRLQEIEFDTDCKTLETALRRFAKKHPAAFEIWGEHIQYMVENGMEFDDGREGAGYFINAFEDDGYFYFDIQIYIEEQLIA